VLFVCFWSCCTDGGMYGLPILCGTIVSLDDSSHGRTPACSLFYRMDLGSLFAMDLDSLRRMCHCTSLKLCIGEVKESAARHLEVESLLLPIEQFGNCSRSKTVVTRNCSRWLMALVV